MSFFFPPPPPFIGGAQPYAPAPLSPVFEAIVLSNPPFTYGGPVALMAEVVSLAQPTRWPYSFMGQAQPYEGAQLPPSQTAIPANNPPFSYGGPIAEIAEGVAIAQPPIWPCVFIGGTQPYAPLQMGGPSGKPDNPPFRYGGPVALLTELVAIAQPNPWTYSYFGAAQPFAPATLNPSLTAVPVNNPPFDSRHTRDIAVMTAIQAFPPPPFQQFYKQKLTIRLATARGFILT